MSLSLGGRGPAGPGQGVGETSRVGGDGGARVDWRGFAQRVRGVVALARLGDLIEERPVAGSYPGRLGCCW